MLPTLQRRLVTLLLCSAFVASACNGCDESVENNRSTDDAGPTSDAGPDPSDSGTPSDSGGPGADVDVDEPDGSVCALQCATECCEAGQECVQGVCRDSCGGVRCGASSELCCEGAEVCIFEGCLVPGQSCQASFECPDGEYCEPTLGSCIPDDAVNVDCEYRPPIGQFTPALKRHFPGMVVGEQNFNGGITAPVVADVDADGKPEVVVQMYRGNLAGGMLIVLNGEDFSVVASGAVNELIPNTAGLAVGQIDPTTPELEIVANAAGGGIAMYAVNVADQTITRVWRNNTGPAGSINYEVAPTLADLDGDGIPEIIAGFSVFDANGDIWNGLNFGPAGAQTGGSAMTVAVDIDQAVDSNGQRHPEIVAGNRVMKLDGTMLWDRSADFGDGYPAVADLDGDGLPEIAVVGQGSLRVFSHDGTLLFGPISLPGGGQGGPPTIADFDGDGRREIAAAGRGRYTVFDPDCIGDTPDPTYCPTGGDGEGILWSIPVQDLSSSRTGSSVFDFDGDGKAEVVYNDECHLRVLDGTNGDILYETPNSTRTGSEMPIVVDVDADFNAEIIVVGNNDQLARDNCVTNHPGYPPTGTPGIHVFGDANDNWVTTRSVWNQHPFHITNVQDNGNIPAGGAPPHYLNDKTNSFRLNVQPDGVFNAPDLTITRVEIRNPSCGENVTVEIAVTVKNAGSLGVAAGTPVVVTATSDSGDTVAVANVVTSQTLLPSQSETILISWTLPAGWENEDFTIDGVVDPDGTINECDASNNTASGTSSAGNLTFDDLVISDLNVNDATCGSNSLVVVDVTIENGGAANVPANLPIVLEALRSSTVVAIDTVRTTAELQPGASESFTVRWTAPPSLFGLQFEVRASIDPNGEVTACSTDARLEPADCLPPQ